VLRAPVKWSPPAAAGCVEPSLRPRVRALAAGCASSPHSDPGYEAVQLLYSCAEPGSATFFYPQGGLSQHAHQVAQAESFRWAGSLSPPTRSPKQNSADCWLLATGRGALRSSDRLQIAQIYGTAEICKTGIQQPLTAAYDFRQIPAGGAMRLNPAEIGDQDCGTLLNLRSHSTQAYEMRPAHSRMKVGKGAHPSTPRINAAPDERENSQPAGRPRDRIHAANALAWRQQQGQRRRPRGLLAVLQERQRGNGRCACTG
jgi:hypothetical protein